MKFLLKLLFILVLVCNPVFAVSFDVLVLPVDLLNTKENYYRFDEVSEIVSQDIIDEFQNTNGKIKTYDLYYVRSKLEENSKLKTATANVLDKYKNNSVDYTNLKILADAFSSKSILLVSSFVKTNKDSAKRGIWDVLYLSSEIDYSYPYRMETAVVLIDTVNDLVMWSNNFSSKLGANDNLFEAKNYSQASAELEKIRLYSKNIVSPSVVQNVMLRFYPKAVRPLDQKIDEQIGGALKFERTLPEKPLEKNKKSDDFYGDMIYGI